MTRLYFKYRYTRTDKTNRLSPSFQYNKMFKDYVEAGIVKMFDLEIPEDYYLTEKRFGYCEFDETKITKDELTYDLRDIPNHIRVCINNSEATDFLDDFTDQRKMPVKDGIYTIKKAGTDELTGEDIPAKILEII